MMGGLIFGIEKRSSNNKCYRIIIKKYKGNKDK